MVCYAQSIDAADISLEIGTLLTAATWMRQFVDKHPGYKHDSVITKEINYDLIKAVDAM
jgi:glutamate--cysteine ligase catalytic subunit